MRRSLPVRKVHATRGKKTRAEPVSALYAQGRVHHVGAFAELEDQYCVWVPDVSPRSPDRLDAAVWVLSHMMIKMNPDSRKESKLPGVSEYHSPLDER